MISLTDGLSSDGERLMTSNWSEPLNYLERIKNYYLGLGYGAPYVWAQLEQIPFSRLTKPLEKVRVGIVTTASIYNPAHGDQGPGAAYNGKSKFFQAYSMPIKPFPDVRIAHIAYDRTHTTASDMASYFPLAAFLRLADSGKIGSVSPSFYGLPTNRSQRVTAEIDCPQLIAFCKRDDVDVAVLVPNCPVCHQSVALAAYQLEAAGISTVIMGCAKDIIEHVGVPRLVFNDLPLGNSAGLPHDRSSQDLVAEMALDLVVEAAGPRTTWCSPLIWSGAHDWKKDYSNIDLLSEDEIASRRAEFDAVKKDAKKIKSAAKTG
jgi:D-proline reductase (dithiol) PrdB